MSRSLYVVAGIILLGIGGALLVLFIKPKMNTSAMPTFSIVKKKFIEIENPSGFVNTEGITLGELVGKKVILVDFMTYSCINCQRTFPYLVDWYDAYKDEGLEIVGIHTPEFAFEKNIENVRDELHKVGITYPVVLDNDYATWRAYGNKYWPRKYLIDIHGNIVYDHIGEGGYVETETKIRELLLERAMYFGEQSEVREPLRAAARPENESEAGTPEIYFGSARNESLAMARRFANGVQELTLPASFGANALYLSGTWNFTPESAESVSETSSIVVRYSAKEVYFVGSSDAGARIEIFQDGRRIGAERGSDVSADGSLIVHDERLYELVRNADAGVHTLEIRVRGKGLEAFTFTFG
jgi:thiol-disulfide isomerase/thioredoxin